VTPLPTPGGKPGPPLGVRLHTSYAVAQTRLEAGDVVVLFTDGIFEQTGPGEEQFGEDRLREAVRRRIGLPPARLFDELLAEVQQFAGTDGFADDVCLLGMEVASLGGA
jgi:sigma-B regulation protein RsbU (phosphoserine phosphatase)